MLLCAAKREELPCLPQVYLELFIDQCLLSQVTVKDLFGNRDQWRWRWHFGATF